MTSTVGIAVQLSLPGGTICTIYRRLIPKSAYMQFLAILTFLHIWKDKSQGYSKMQSPWQFLQNKRSNLPPKKWNGSEKRSGCLNYKFLRQQ